MFIYIIYYPVILFISNNFFNMIFTKEEINNIVVTTLEN